MTKETFNTERLLALFRKLHSLALTLFFISFCGNLVLGYRLYRLVWKTEVYFVSAEGTFMAKRFQIDQERPFREKCEVENFLYCLTEKMFAHTCTSYEENLKKLLDLLDERSMQALLNLLENQGESPNFGEVIRNHGGLTSVVIKEIVLDTKQHPFRAKVSYEQERKVVGTNEKVQKIKGILYVSIEVIPRSSKNPYGLLATNLNLPELETQN